MAQRFVEISEKRTEKKIIFKDIFWALKLCLQDFVGQSLHCSINLQGKEWRKNGVSVISWGEEPRLRDLAGQSLRCSIILWGKSALPLNFAGKRHSFKSKNTIKIRFTYFSKNCFGN